MSISKVPVRGSRKVASKGSSLRATDESRELPGHGPTHTLVSMLQARAAQHPDRVALRFLGDDGLPLETLSYAQLHASCSELAVRLRQQARGGDRALLLYPSGPEYVKAFLSCLYAGIVAVPAYP